MKKQILTVLLLCLLLTVTLLLVACNDTGNTPAPTPGGTTGTTENPGGNQTGGETGNQTGGETGNQTGGNQTGGGTGNQPSGNQPGGETTHTHSFSEWTIARAATCTENGVKERVCSCGEKETQKLPATGHTEVIDPAVGATLSVPGKTEGSHCSSCGKVFVEQKAALASIGLEYEFYEDADGYIVVGFGSCYDENIVIPSSYKGKPVIGIAIDVDEIDIAQLNKVKSFLIPESIIFGEWEWYSDDEDAVNVVESLTVAGGNPIFRSVGNCIIEIGTKTLVLGCKNSTIPADGSVTVIGDGAFDTCAGLTNITIPNGVTSINYGAFSGCTSLTSITIPDSVTAIGYGAFANCMSLTSITVPDSVTSIKSGAFHNTGYYNDENNWENGVLYIGKCLVVANSDVISGAYVVKSGTICIVGWAFCDCVGLTSVVIPDGVTSIGQYAFDGCTNLRSVTIGNGVTNIEEYAFSYCTSLTNIIIPNSVTSIEQNVFHSCTSLTSITIPNSVTNIDGYVFYNCTGLMNITFQGTKAQWNQISKGYGWNAYTGTIHCTDGDITKQ